MVNVAVDEFSIWASGSERFVGKCEKIDVPDRSFQKMEGAQAKVSSALSIPGRNESAAATTGNLADRSNTCMHISDD